MSARVPVTYLFTRWCPSHEEGLALLRRAAEDAGVDLDLEAVEIRSDAEAEAHRFAGSPTYLVLIYMGTGFVTNRLRWDGNQTYGQFVVDSRPLLL